MKKILKSISTKISYINLLLAAYWIGIGLYNIIAKPKVYPYQLGIMDILFALFCVLLFADSLFIKKQQKFIDEILDFAKGLIKHHEEHVKFMLELADKLGIDPFEKEEKKDTKQEKVIN